jgi:hypothetical protein
MVRDEYRAPSLFQETRGLRKRGIQGVEFTIDRDTKRLEHRCGWSDAPSLNHFPSAALDNASEVPTGLQLTFVGGTL